MGNNVSENIGTSATATPAKAASASVTPAKAASASVTSATATPAKAASASVTPATATPAKAAPASVTPAKAASASVTPATATPAKAASASVTRASKTSANAKPPAIETPTAGPQKIGFVLLGNTGRGKSYLANLLLQKNYFESDFRTESVTRRQSHAEVPLKDYNITAKVFDVPGFIEADQSKIQENIREIQAALAETENCVIGYVFTGAVGGRLIEEDVVAFQALSSAYVIDPESLFFIVNEVPRKTSPLYEAQMIENIKLHTKIEYDPEVCFIPYCDDDNKEGISRCRNHLLAAINALTAKRCELRKQLQLQRKEIDRMRLDLSKNQKEFESQLERMKTTLEEMQCLYEKKLLEKNTQIEDATNRGRMQGIMNLIHLTYDMLVSSGGNEIPVVNRPKQAVKKDAWTKQA